MFLFKRKEIYYVEYFDENLQKIKRVSTKAKTKAAALKYVAELKKQFNIKIKAKSISMTEFKDEYILYLDASYSRSYLKSVKLSFKMLEKFMGNKCLDEISNRDIESFIMATYKRARHSSHLYHRTLKAAFSKAVLWNYIDENPFLKVKLPRISNRLPVFITSNELDQINKNVTNPVLRSIFIVAFYTGMRQSEIVNLEWSSINFEDRIIKVSNSIEFTTKNKQERIIPMNKNCYDAIIGNKGNNSRYVFPNITGYKYNKDYVSKSFKNAIRKTGLSESIHFHTLRHSFASNLVQNGVDLYVVKELLGHGSIVVTQIYSHIKRGNLIDAILKLD